MAVVVEYDDCVPSLLVSAHHRIERHVTQQLTEKNKKSG